MSSFKLSDFRGSLHDLDQYFDDSSDAIGNLFEGCNDYIRDLYEIIDTSSTTAIEVGAVANLAKSYIDSIEVYDSSEDFFDSYTLGILEDIIDDVADDGILNDYDYQNLIDSTYDASSYVQINLARIYSIAQYSSCYAQSVNNNNQKVSILAAMAIADATAALAYTYRGLYDLAQSGNYDVYSIQAVLDDAVHKGGQASAFRFMRWMVGIPF